MSNRGWIYFAIGLLACFGGGIAGGYGLARQAIEAPPPAGIDSIQYGAWQLHGSGQGLLARAQLARLRAVALHASEALYFSAHEDSTGEPLRRKCIYRIEGDGLWGQWWSFTAYDSAMRLISNPQAHYSFTRRHFEAMERPRWSLTLSQNMAHGPWLPVGEPNRREAVLARETEPALMQDDALVLQLRIYHPPPDFIAQLASGAIVLPLIEREACFEGAAR